MPTQTRRPASCRRCFSGSANEGTQIVRRSCDRKYGDERQGGEDAAWPKADRRPHQRGDGNVQQRGAVSGAAIRVPKTRTPDDDQGRTQRERLDGPPPRAGQQAAPASVDHRTIVGAGSNSPQHPRGTADQTTQTGNPSRARMTVTPRRPDRGPRDERSRRRCPPPAGERIAVAAPMNRLGSQAARTASITLATLLMAAYSRATGHTTVPERPAGRSTRQVQPPPAAWVSAAGSPDDGL